MKRLQPTFRIVSVLLSVPPSAPAAPFLPFDEKAFCFFLAGAALFFEEDEAALLDVEAAMDQEEVEGADKGEKEE